MKSKITRRKKKNGKKPDSFVWDWKCQGRRLCQYKRICALHHNVIALNAEDNEKLQ